MQQLAKYITALHNTWNVHKMLLIRLKLYSENIIGEHQAGFGKEISTIDQLYTVSY